MAMIINTAAGFHDLPPRILESVYNGLDCCVTRMVFDAIEPMLKDETTRRVYNFEMACLKPALTMMFRGIRVDPNKKLQAAEELERTAARHEKILAILAEATWGKPLNPRSYQQLQSFFYEYLGRPVEKEQNKGEWKVSTGEKALLRIASKDRDCSIFVGHILAARHYAKQATFLRAEVEADGRMRCWYSASTKTGRWASRSNAFGRGLNLQNLPHEVRYVFIADPGYTMYYADLDRAESVAVAYLADDQDYIDAVSASDVHLAVARSAFVHVAWDPTVPHDKKLAEQHLCPCDRCKVDPSDGKTYRQKAKALGHASNYMATAPTLAKHSGIILPEVRKFQAAYFRGFRRIRPWHASIDEQLQETQIITTPFFCRERRFFDDPAEDKTLRDAVAYGPQSMVADILNLGMYRIWRDLEPKGLQLLAQVHDAVLFQVPNDQLHLADEAVRLMQYPILMPSGKLMQIGASANSGQDWMVASGD